MKWEVAEGVLGMAVDDCFVDGTSASDERQVLRVLYSANGEEYTVTTRRKGYATSPVARDIRPWHLAPLIFNCNAGFSNQGI